MAAYGVNERECTPLLGALERNPRAGRDFMMRFELGLERPNKNRAHQSALVIGVSYVIGGLIPLSAYFFNDTTQQGLIYSSIITFFCLITFGLVKSKLTGQPLFKGAMRVTLVGGAAAAAAFLIAKWIA